MLQGVLTAARDMYDYFWIRKTEISSKKTYSSKKHNEIIDQYPLTKEQKESFT